LLLSIASYEKNDENLQNGNRYPDGIWCLGAVGFEMYLLRRRVLLTSMIAFGFLPTASNLFGQSGELGSVTIKVVSEAPVGRVIPDPSNVESLVSLLHNGSIVKELNLDQNQKKELSVFLGSSGGSFNTVLVPFRPGMTEAEIKIERELKLARNRLLFQSLLDPNQEVRLRQIAYRVEIARSGLASALTDGFFGEHIGVMPYEKPALLTMATAIDKEMNIAIRDVVLDMRKRVLQDLTGLQQSQAVDVLGEWFVFVEEPGTALSAGFESLDPENSSSMLILTRNKSVARELGFDDKKIAAIKAEQKKSSFANASAVMNASRMTKEDRRLILETARASNDAIMESLMTDKERNRLKQVAYQIEIARIGIVEALVRGYLGKKLQVTELQRSELKKRSNQVTESDAIDKIIRMAKDRMIKELTPIQQKKAGELLGKDFKFVEVGHGLNGISR
jgi:hypothetical protein